MAGPLDNVISFPHGRPHTLCLRSSEDPCLDLPSFFTFACRSKWQKYRPLMTVRWNGKSRFGGQYNQLTSLGLHYLPHSFDTTGLQRVPVQWKQTWGRAFFPHVWSCSSACWATSRERAEVELRSAKCGVTKQPAIRQTPHLDAIFNILEWAAVFSFSTENGGKCYKVKSNLQTTSQGLSSGIRGAWYKVLFNLVVSCLI